MFWFYVKLKNFNCLLKLPRLPLKSTKLKLHFSTQVCLTTIIPNVPCLLWSHTYNTLLILTSQCVKATLSYSQDWLKVFCSYQVADRLPRLIRQSGLPEIFHGGVQDGADVVWQVQQDVTDDNSQQDDRQFRLAQRRLRRQREDQKPLGLGLLPLDA